MEAPDTPLWRGRLPNGVTPRHYDIALALNPNEPYFAGETSMAVELLEPQSNIVLHGLGLHIERVAVQDQQGDRHAVRIRELPEQQALQLMVDPPLPAGMVTLYFRYTAALDDDLMGLYRAVDGNHRFIFSQFEPIGARRVFPCFDEPHFKTPYNLSVTVPQALTVVANAAMVGEREVGDGKKICLFEATPPLPTSLWGFAVGPLEHLGAQVGVSPQRPYTLPARALWATGQAAPMAALERVERQLLDTEAYLDVAYPFTKLDLLAMPELGYQATDTVALMGFQSRLMTFADGPHSYRARRRWERLLAMQLSHAWFGGWVGMPWYDDQWLHSALGTWRGLSTATQTRPGMHFDTEFVALSDDAMRNDADGTRRQVREPVLSRDDIFSATDPITSDKGAAVLRMFERGMGTERFRRGVQKYVKSHPFQTASSHQFMQAMATATGVASLPESLTSFLDQPGVPELTWEVHCDGAAAHLTVSQQAYRPLGGMPQETNWKMPVCFRVGGMQDQNSRHPVCVSLREQALAVPLAQCPAWLVPNADGAGYYRSRMAAGSWQQLEQALLHRRARPTEWISVLGDLNAALAAGSLPAEPLLALMERGLSHPHPQVARRALRLMRDVFERHLDVEAQAHCASRWGALLQPAQQAMVREARIDSEAHAAVTRSKAELMRLADRRDELSLWRHDLTETLVQSGQHGPSRATLAHAGALWLDHAETQDSVAPPAQGHGASDQVAALLLPEDVGMALTEAMEALGEPFVQRVLALQTNAAFALRPQVLEALGQVRAPANVALVLQAALAPNWRAHERFELLVALMGQAASREAAWDFLVHNMDVFAEGVAGKDRARLVHLGGRLCREDAASMLAAVFADDLQRWPGAREALEVAVSENARCVAESAAQSQSVRAFFCAGTKPQDEAPASAGASD